jgi:ribonuclease III
VSGLFSWLFEKLRQREERNKSKHISRLLTHQKFNALEEVVGVPIKDRSYFIQALIHRSFLEQNTDYTISNERLEFLGDSVLSLIVAEFLFETFPDKDEGFLTKIRARLVNRSALADAAKRIDLSKFLLVSKNFSTALRNGSSTVIADAFEAIIGAIYLDSGLEAARSFIEKAIIEPNSKDDDYLIDENFKSQLLEYTQANKLDSPTYTVIKEEGPQHNRIFTIKVEIGSQEFGKGRGRNKKSAEQNAAAAALHKIYEEKSDSL